jgi:hypothetical protein
MLVTERRGGISGIEYVRPLASDDAKRGSVICLLASESGGCAYGLRFYRELVLR